MLGGFVECISFDCKKNSSVWVQKEMATYKDQILMFYLDNAKDLGNHLMVAFTSSPSHVPFFKCDFLGMECTYKWFWWWV
jgi:hypothetical protein